MLLARQVPALHAIDGYEGSLLLEHPVGDGVEIMVVTFWRSPDAIHGFAGVDAEAAVVADEAAALLTQFDRRVRHYRVAVRDAPRVH
jgi:heme-degrading monooxygenase HmoA